MIYEIILSIYSLSSVMETYGETFTAYGYKVMILVNLIEVLALCAVYYAFRSVALYKMAKRRGVGNAYTAFIPFAAFILMGKLQASGKYASKTKNYYIVALALAAVSVALSLSIDILYALKPLQVIFSGVAPVEADFTSSFLYNVLSILEELTSLAYVVFALFTFSNVYKAYDPQKVSKYTIITIIGYFCTSSLFFAGVFLFVCRNFEPVNFDEYVESTRARFYSRNGYPPYGGNGNYRGGRTSANEDPFAEFSDKKVDDPFSDFGSAGNSNNSGSSSDNSSDDSDGLF